MNLKTCVVTVALLCSACESDPSGEVELTAESASEQLRADKVALVAKLTDARVFISGEVLERDTFGRSAIVKLRAGSARVWLYDVDLQAAARLKNGDSVSFDCRFMSVVGADWLNFKKCAAR